MEMFSFPIQLQSNLIPGLNLNALGLFPSGAPGMGPSMSSIPPPGAHGGCSSFGVSGGLVQEFCPHMLPFQTRDCQCFFFINLLLYSALIRIVRTTINKN